MIAVTVHGFTIAELTNPVIEEKIIIIHINSSVNSFTINRYHSCTRHEWKDSDMNYDVNINHAFL